MKYRIDPTIIKAARLAKGLTQVKLATTLGYGERIGEKMIQAIESGRRPVPVQKIVQLADTLGLDVRDLLPK
jgi:transcriptional regulator with XRE-family HTH domain